MITRGIKRFTVYTLHLKIEKEKSTLSLVKDGVVAGASHWDEGRDMGKRLFQGIDTLLKENNLQPEQIEEFMIDSAMPENYTSMRIAETVQKVYTFAVKNK